MSYGYRGYDRGYSGDGIGWLPRLIPILIGLIAIGATMVRGCQHGPFGRTQVVGMTPQQEARLGLQAYHEVLSTSHVARTDATVNAVKQIAKRLTDATQSEEFQNKLGIAIPEFEWEVNVVEENQVNAFCLPGGKIVVYTGIIPVAVSDAGLATVLGHEIGHALAHHGAERMAQQRIAQIGLTSVGASIGDMDPAKRQQVMQALNVGAKFGILSYSRSHESEADHIGLLLMSAAGYDPRESLQFWKRMSSATSGQGAPPEFMSTHPNHGTRIKNLTNWMPEALPLYDHSPHKSHPRVLPGVENYERRPQQQQQPRQRGPRPNS